MAGKNPQEVANHRRMRILARRGYVELLLRLCVIALAVWILLSHVFLLTRCQGIGMFPAVKDGDLIIAYRLEQDYERNDVVVCQTQGQRFVGRVVAVGGDVIAMDETGTLLVNEAVQSGQILYATYPKEGLTYPYCVPEGTVFLLGDYRTHTRDSRDFGPIPLKDVEGKAITILRRRGI